VISISKIEDAWKTDALANITGIKSVQTHESDLDAKTLAMLIPQSPFVFLRWGGIIPDPGERMADEASGSKKCKFFLSVGATSLLSRQTSQRGAYDILDAIIDRYDGRTLTTTEGSIDLALESAEFLFSDGGLIVYGVEFSYYDN